MNAASTAAIIICAGVIIITVYINRVQARAIAAVVSRAGVAIAASPWRGITDISSVAIINRAGVAVITVAVRFALKRRHEAPTVKRTLVRSIIIMHIQSPGAAKPLPIKCGK